MRWIGLAGMASILGVAWLLSRNRKAIRWRTIAWAFALELALGWAVLSWDAGKQALARFAAVVATAIGYADRGGAFVFGWLAGPMDDIGRRIGLPLTGYLFAFKVLPIIVFLCALFSILYHVGLLPRLVEAMAWGMRRTMRVSGAEALCVAANVFLGQTEAPVLVAPYIAGMTTSELMTLMTGGMAHISGAVMLAYAAMGVPLPYLITASVMAAPGTFLVAKLLWPETSEPATMELSRARVERTSANVIDAAASGASQGMALALNIAAMLIAFVALVAMTNGILGWVGELFGAPGFQLQTVFGWVFGPVAFLLGAPRADSRTVGALIANKTVINEFFAFAMMKDVAATLSEKGRLIATFSLCGFANFASIGIQIGGIGGLAPSRKGDLARLGLWALLAGSLVSFLTAALAGLLSGL